MRKGYIVSKKGAPKRRKQKKKLQPIKSPIVIRTTPPIKAPVVIKKGAVDASKVEESSQSQRRRSTRMAR